MFRIGEFSKLTQVSVRMLRYYDQNGLLPPAKTDPESGYRYYSAHQIPILNKIVFLRDLGMNVKEIADALLDWNSIETRLEEQKREIEWTIEQEQEKLNAIQRAVEEELSYSVTIKAVPGMNAFCLRRRVADYYAEGELWKEMAAYAAEHQLAIANDTVSIYHDVDYREQDVDIEICTATEQLGECKDGFVFRAIDPVEHMASTMVYGPFENIAGAYHAVANWLEHHSGFCMLGESRQIVHRGPWNESDSKNYLTEIQIPLEKR